jgi:hypothetical protein
MRMAVEILKRLPKLPKSGGESAFLVVRLGSKLISRVTILISLQVSAYSCKQKGFE